jgi:DNA-directed RNA polymerase III subunit RPC1
MNRLARLSSRWIGTRGFSIGIDDVTPSKRLIKLKEATIKQGYDFCYDKIKQWKSGKLEPASGMNEEQTLEATCLGELSKKRDDVSILLPYERLA